jgi:Kef-type K+ transport system membrane component KefB
MFDEPFIQSLGLIVIAGALFALVARLIRMPAIVAYLIAGLVLGPLTGLVVISPTLSLISEVGIALLLFLVGLELSFDKIRDVGPVSVVAGLGQVLFTALGGLLICWLLGFGLMDGVFLAVALTFSSTVVVVKLLDEKQELDSLYGRIAVGIFLVQDLVAIVILTFLTGLSGEGERTAGAILMGVARAVGGMALLLGAVLVALVDVLFRDRDAQGLQVVLGLVAGLAPVSAVDDGLGLAVRDGSAGLG